MADERGRPERPKRRTPAKGRGGKRSTRARPTEGSTGRSSAPRPGSWEGTSDPPSDEPTADETAPISERTPIASPVPASVIRALRNPLVAIAAGALLAALVAGAFLLRPASYRSQATLLIDQPGAIALAEDAGLIAKLTSLRFKYTGLVRTSRIVEPVAQDLGLDEDLVARSVDASAPAESMLVRVTATTGDPDRAVSIARTTAEELVEYVEDEQASAGVPADARFAFDLVDDATAAVQVAPSTVRGVAAAGLSGLVAASLVLAVGYTLQPTARRPADAA